MTPTPSKSFGAARSSCKFRSACIHRRNQERCLFPLMNEGFRVLGEGIALRAADIDVVWTSGVWISALSRWADVPQKSGA
jgi:hypothetical protein